MILYTPVNKHSHGKTLHLFLVFEPSNHQNAQKYSNQLCLLKTGVFFLHTPNLGNYFPENQDIPFKKMVGRWLEDEILTQPMDPEKNSLNFIFPTKYVIPKSLKFSHWPSKNSFEMVPFQVTFVHFQGGHFISIQRPHWTWGSWSPLRLSCGSPRTKHVL